MTTINDRLIQLKNWARSKPRPFWFSLVLVIILVSWISYDGYRSDQCNREFNQALTERADIQDQDTKLHLQFEIENAKWADDKAKAPASEQASINNKAAGAFGMIVGQAEDLLDRRSQHKLPPPRCGADKSS